MSEQLKQLLIEYVPADKVEEALEKMNQILASETINPDPKPPRI